MTNEEYKKIQKDWMDKCNEKRCQHCEDNVHNDSHASCECVHFYRAGYEHGANDFNKSAFHEGYQAGVLALVKQLENHAFYDANVKKGVVTESHWEIYAQLLLKNNKHAATMSHCLTIEDCSEPAKPKTHGACGKYFREEKIWI